MTASAELTSGQHDELVAALTALKGDLEVLLEVSRESVQPVDLDQPIGRLSRIDAIQQQKMAQSSRQNHTRRLQQVKAALVAVDVGVYGECKQCEEDIGYPRLVARPEAPLCVDCQTAVERR